MQIKYFIALPPHGHGDGPQHWHARFGSRSIGSLISGAGKWPTYYSSSIPKSDLVKMFESSISNMPKWLPVSPFESYAKHGKWINSISMAESTAKEVEAVYAKVLKEYAGKNPKGGDFTKQDVINQFKKVYGPGKDFTHMDFIVKNGKNELVISKDGKFFRSSYVRVAASKAKPYLTMKAEKNNAGKYSLISFVVVHGDPAHFHLFYGANEEEIANQVGTPTCYKAERSNAEIAAGMENSIKRQLDSLIKTKK
ncbi:hypothetical protein [Treponema sp. OMZ 791]|uniref:hypothetical protein n=1 Tax=Treponema sp. OMZ 791 TaxID=2563666 RepID=UPI0020A4CE30|nr:hypothetical protein [Treponema sp. OMZ 791]